MLDLDPAENHVPTSADWALLMLLVPPTGALPNCSTTLSLDPFQTINLILSQILLDRCTSRTTRS